MADGYQEKPNMVNIFRNTRKSNDKQPDWTGDNIAVSCVCPHCKTDISVPMRLAMYEKVGKVPYFRVILSPPFVRDRSNGANPPAATAFHSGFDKKPDDPKSAELDDNIPF